MTQSRLPRSLFLAALPAAYAATARPARAQGLTPLRVGATANDTYAEAYYAQDLGIFTKAGLAVEITTFTNGAAVSSAIAAGALDVGNFQSDSTRERGESRHSVRVYRRRRTL